MSRYTEMLFSSVCVERDILFATLPGYNRQQTPTELAIDVYAPEGDTEENRRAVILVHGGGFCGGDRRKGFPERFGSLLAQYGYVCFSVDYRLFLEGNRPKHPTAAPYAAMDIECARRFITENAERFRVDAAHIAICGASAGGMGSLEACRIYPDYRAFICLCGTFEHALVPPIYPPTLLLHGTADTTVPYTYSEAFFARLQERGIPSELVTLQGVAHSVSAHLPEYAKKIINFLDAHS